MSQNCRRPALLDAGSSVSLIIRKNAECLVGQLPWSSPILLENVNTISAVAAISLDLTNAPYKASAAMLLRIVFAVPTLNLQTFVSAPFNSLCRQYPHLKHVWFPYLKPSTADLLIGSYQFDLIHSRSVIVDSRATQHPLRNVDQTWLDNCRLFDTSDNSCHKCHEYLIST